MLHFTLTVKKRKSKLVVNIFKYISYNLPLFHNYIYLENYKNVREIKDADSNASFKIKKIGKTAVLNRHEK